MKKSCLSIILALCLMLSSCAGILPNADPQPCALHSDSDVNGVCDRCYLSVVETFDFYAINDLHGKFDDTDSNVGVDELTTYLKNAQKTNKNAVLLSSGDMWQGSSESNLTYGNIITEWMNELDFTSMTLGNHEYDWGEEYISANLELADFPFLAINVYDRQTNLPVEYCQPSAIVEQNGTKIGIIGAIGDCYSSISSEKVEDIYFKVGDELTELILNESMKLRRQGADFIILSLHDGHDRSSSGTKSVADNEISDYYDLSLSRDGHVDLVFEGHSHSSYVLKDSYGVYHLQNGGENKGISHARVKINYAADVGVVVNAEFISSSTYSRLDDDPIVDSLLQKYEGQISAAHRVLGTLNSSLSSDAIKKIVAEEYCKLGEDTWGDEFQIVLGGGYLNTRSPYKLEAGEIRYSHVQSVLPFDNSIVLCSIKGSDLISRFINNSDYTVYFSEYGKSIKGNIDPDATYYVVVDTYSSTYAPNRLTEIKRFDDSTFARDLLAKYIENVS